MIPFSPTHLERREVVALGYAEAVSRGATYRVLSWLPGTTQSVRHADSCDHTRSPCAGGPECAVGPVVAEAVIVEDDAGSHHILGRDCALHAAVPFAPVEAVPTGAIAEAAADAADGVRSGEDQRFAPGVIGDSDLAILWEIATCAHDSLRDLPPDESRAGLAVFSAEVRRLLAPVDLPDVVVYIPGGAAQGAWVIEPPAGHAPRLLVPSASESVINPRRGVHYASGCHEPAADDAACSWAWALQPGRRHGRVAVQLDAEGALGVGDAVTAAAFWQPSVPSRETWARIRLVAESDNAVTRYELGDWAPGQAHLQVSDGHGNLPGLWRICACRSISIQRRVQLVWQWCLRGEVALTADEREALGVAPVLPEDAYSVPVMRALTALAREQLAADRATLTVRLWGDAPGGALRAEIDPTDTIPFGPGPVYRPLVALVSGPGLWAFALGYDVAPICVAVSPPDARGARLVTVGRATNARQVRLDFPGLVARLSQLESQGVGFAAPRATEWGGNHRTLVLGSPKPGGTHLDPDLIVRTVLEYSTRVTS